MAQTVGVDLHHESRPRRVVERLKAEQLIFEVNHPATHADEEPVAASILERLAATDRLFIQRCRAGDLAFYARDRDARVRDGEAHLYCCVVVGATNLDGRQHRCVLLGRAQLLSVECDREVAHDRKARPEYPAEHPGSKLLEEVFEIAQRGRGPRLGRVSAEEHVPRSWVAVLQFTEELLGASLVDDMQPDGDRFGGGIILAPPLDLMEVHRGIQEAAIVLAHVRQTPGEHVGSEFADAELADGRTPSRTRTSALPRVRNTPELREAGFVHPGAVVDDPERILLGRRVSTGARTQDPDGGCAGVVAVRDQLLDRFVRALVEPFGEEPDDFVADLDGYRLPRGLGVEVREKRDGRFWVRGGDASIRVVGHVDWDRRG